MATKLESIDSSADYEAATPFPHIVIDDAFPEAQVREVAAEVNALEVPSEPDGYGTVRKHRLSDLEALPPKTRALVEQLQSDDFLKWLEGVSGIDNLVADHGLEGGGVHRIFPGGFLKIHADFSWSKALQLHRRLNLLLYLNPGWDEEWGGELELWQKDMSACARRVAPLFNRMVIFSTTADSFHGHPEPLRCPEGVTRNSIALYYYSADRPADQIPSGPTTLTDYRTRPQERFGSLKHSIHRLMIRFPGLRKLLRR